MMKYRHKHRRRAGLGKITEQYRMQVMMGCCMLFTFLAQSRAYAADWPMWRYNAGRCAASPEQLPAQLHLQWVRELAPPKPAWPESEYRLQFDASYEPVVAGETLFVGSMVSDSVTAYDTDTGTETWRFYTEGPVRFAPVVYRDKLYVASDDGYLYCLNARTGALIRKFLGGPAPKKVLGNDRLTSMWPMRGGPVLYEDTIYFAASIWPFMGIFIHAIDAATGDVIWTNSGSGQTYLMQPHSSPAFAGVAPQGYLVATQDKLLISGGRSVPAAYDRRTGEFLYYHLNKYGKTGACEVIASGEHFFNRGAVYRLSDGITIPGAPASVITDDAIIGRQFGLLVASQFEVGARKPKRLWRSKAPSKLRKIHLKADTRLYGSGEDGLVMAIDTPRDSAEAVLCWQAEVDGEVWSMLVADGKLFVVTLQGKIYCFAGKETEPKRYARFIKPIPDTVDPWTDKAAQLLEQTGQREGYCVLLGLGTGDLLSQLVRQSDLHVIAIDSDRNQIDAVRRRLDRAGVYGTRVSLHLGDITTVQLPPYMAHLIVSEDLHAAGLDRAGSFMDRVYHPLRPYGGTACFSLPQSSQGDLFAQVVDLKLPSCTITSSEEFISITRSGALPDSADWTHQYGDAANSVMSRDKRVKAPLGLLWFGGPANDKILPRHGHGPAPQVVDGRLFIEGRDMLRAVDVYTGRLLWERQFPDLGEYYDNTSHQPGANEIGSNYVSVSDAVYVVHEKTIHVLDPATGLTTQTFSLPDQAEPRWGTLAIWNDLLLATAAPVDVPLTDKQTRTKVPDAVDPIIAKGSEWRYLSGSHPDPSWTQLDFNADTWQTAGAGFGYNDDDNQTVLEDMKKHYSSVYIRKSFSLAPAQDIHELGLVIKYDDAFIAYLNGKEILRVGVFKGSGARASGMDKHERKGWEYFRIDQHHELLREGSNLLAIEGHNRKIDSSAFALNPYLVVLRDGDSDVNSRIKKAGWGNLSGITVNADFAASSKMLVAMDCHSGAVLWKRKARYGFRHNAITMAANRVFCIDGMSPAKMAYLGRRGLKLDMERTLYALDARTGERLWKSSEGIFGTWLAYSTDHDVLLQAGSRSGDRAEDEIDRGMAAYAGADGTVLWRNSDSYKGPPILYHDRIITQTGGGSGSAAPEAKAFELLTGETVQRQHPLTGETIPWTWVRFKGCNTATASENLLTFRSASGAFVDLTGTQSTASIGGFKSGCTSNLICANGVLNAPDYTRTCVCSYQNQASLALIHMPEIVHWSFDYYRNPDEAKPVKEIGINFGAPGNRSTADKRLWLEFPSVGGPSPDVPIRAQYDDAEWFRHHSSKLKGPHNWIGASGVTGLREVSIRMFIQPGNNPSSVNAFAKHIDNIPIWREAQLTGAFAESKPYTVRLYFAETEDVQTAQRRFNVALQDKPVLEGFDIVREAGQANRTVVKEFKGIHVKDDLKVSLTPATEDSAAPLICGIEILAEGW
jgi:outer membrane protein assembly factor BamB